MDLNGPHVDKYFVMNLAQYNAENTAQEAEVHVKKSYDLIK